MREIRRRVDVLERKRFAQEAQAWYILIDGEGHVVRVPLAKPGSDRVVRIHGVSLEGDI